MLSSFTRSSFCAIALASLWIGVSSCSPNQGGNSLCFKDSDRQIKFSNDYSVHAMSDEFSETKFCEGTLLIVKPVTLLLGGDLRADFPCVVDGSFFANVKITTSRSDPFKTLVIKVGDSETIQTIDNKDRLVEVLHGETSLTVCPNSPSWDLVK